MVRCNRGLPAENLDAASQRAVMLSQKTRYALKAMIALAGLEPGECVSAASIAAQCNIPPKFLEAILSEFTRHGLVWGHRGRGGGYQLAKKPADITFGSVVRLMQGPLALVPCASQTRYRRCEDCPDEGACEIRTLFKRVRDSTARILDQQTLADSAHRKRVSRIRHSRRAL
jgi:Rrf2 family protein